MNITTSPDPKCRKRGFTLIEISIVLVIIGFIVGGILVGRDLIKAAEIRATIGQVDKYNAAVHTFQDKYNGTPGDITARQATMFGFAPRGTYTGQGDGDGIIKGSLNTGCGFCEGIGETAMFWSDLTYANGINLNLIEGSYNQASSNGNPGLITGAALNGFFPKAKIGAGNFFYVWSGGPTLSWNGVNEIGSNGINYFGLSAVTQLNFWELTSSPGLTVQQAYAIDTKVDDGLPQSGNITTLYLNGALQYVSPVWAGTPNTGVPYTTATAGSSTSCFDNSNVGGAPMQYSIGQNGGSGVNCALSFQFQ